MSNEVDRIYSELNAIKGVITDMGSPSDIVAFEPIASKSMLLATTSYFEKVICEMIMNHAERMSKATTIVSFIDKQALRRKYHTLFNWEKSNINKFIRLFGPQFSEYIEPQLNKDEIKSAVKEFMLLGQMRNELVHNNYSEYPMQMTTGDIKGKFDTALPLMVFLAESLSQFELARLQEPNSHE